MILSGPSGASLDLSKISFTYANEAARLAAVLAAADKGKFAFQTDNSTFYIVVNNVGPVWSQVSNHAVTGTGNPNGVLPGEFGQSYFETISLVWYKCVSNPSGTVWRII